jgi:diguanylate cyclase (GGDEF)-like protein/PAS domain S-box-containing protein
LSSKEIYLYQAVAMIIAILLPWASFFIYLSNLNPFPGLDITAIAFGFTGSILVFIILRWQFMDVIPVARETLVEQMADGVLVLDAENRIIDLNSAARQLFGFKSERMLGQKIESMLTDCPELTNLMKQTGSMEKVITIQSPELHYIDLRVSPIKQRKGKTTGHLIVLRDVTSSKQAEEDIRRAHQSLQEKLAEIEKLHLQLREQSIRDPLTGLFNRRYLEDGMKKEMARAQRGHYSVSVMVVDVDHFKELNDLHGHKTGDDALVALAHFLLSMVREGDIIYRYGGDEFLVVMPGIHPDEILSRAESLRKGFEALTIRSGKAEYHATISIGAAVYPQDSETIDGIIQTADTAMYAAKHAGRNRVHLHGGTN